MTGKVEITDHLKCVTLDLKATTRRGVIEELVGLLVKSGIRQNKKETVNALMNRESEGSTGIGKGVAIPHAKLKTLKSPVIAFGRSVKGIDFSSIDKKAAHLFFLILSPTEKNLQLRTLARISRFSNESSFRNRLKAADTEEEILQIIKEKDKD